MPGFSIHVVDVSRGVPAAGIQVNVYALESTSGARRMIAGGSISPSGTLDDPRLAVTFEPGIFEVVLDLEEFYRKSGVVLPAVPFLGLVTYRFGIADGGAHYHLPFKCTPWGYSCFRGGA